MKGEGHWKTSLLKCASDAYERACILLCLATEGTPKHNEKEI